jgi:hypothetical protein
MFFSEIKIMKRKNLGNYEHKEIALTLALNEEDNPSECLLKGEAFVSNALNEVKMEVKKQEKVEEEVKETPVKKKVTKKKKTAKKVEPEVLISKEELNKKLVEVAKFYKSKEKAIALLEEVGGVKSIGELPEDKWNTLAKMCEAVLNG